MTPQENIKEAITKRFGKTSGYLNPCYDSFIELIIDTERQRIKEEMERFYNYLAREKSCLLIRTRKIGDETYYFKKEDLLREFEKVLALLEEKK